MTRDTAIHDTDAHSESDAGHSWRWIPTLYFGQGIPYVAVMTLSVIMYKNMGISNADIALYTSWLYLPFVIKPLWSPFVDMFRTKRFWIITLELLIGGLFGLVALTIPVAAYFQATLAVFWLLGFAAATHDISTDGFYMLALEQHQQAALVGVRSMFFRISMLTGQGALVYLAGTLRDVTGNIALGWIVVFGVLALMFISLSLYHRWALPVPESDSAHGDPDQVMTTFFTIFGQFIRKKNILITLAFLLLYRFGEAQLVKMAPPFLLDGLDKGGLGLSTQAVGIVYGTMGMIALTAGGLAGGALIARYGLKKCLWPMALAINVPHLVYVYLALVQPQNLYLVGAAVALEQMGYGFGFTAYVLYMIMVADGEHKTAHYAICTGFMAASMMLPGMFSGWLQSWLGYSHFFIWICVAAVPTLIVTALIEVDPSFGKKTDEKIK
ncbi:AmpG family muropeptide MFS transporter [Undibacterium oligocarboniphilum]|uniref:AmpG family muropeptide MFS transporter n=1 Tax=Undibacterium oligocarboniphilum TaxID=666702 RepID=A0A850QEM7_9BURK|nr:AmpG family muropeptide MFS transporter [Undibacterium oligocarboniphilum]MBC3869754.1 AmpG family muropeptide MFS transporter [Undibacterium oligocarboniphilum]NVO77357.1 AmpG family muropeptide MFS transporter [Undibacterium oligocarboniphilum]